MFTIWFTNFEYSHHVKFPTLNSAKEKAKSFGFQSVIIDSKSNVICSYCPINGFENF